MITIISAEEAYLPEVLALEQAAFAPAWTEGSLLKEIWREETYFALAVDDDAVLGFCILRRMSDEGELYQIAVQREWQRQGIAAQLLSAALNDCALHGVAAIYLEVRRSNVSAISLYRKSGFVRQGLRKNYYSSPVEDAVVLVCRLDSD